VLGEKIQKLRKSKGLSQEQLGDKVNVTRQTISNWELNETTPNIEQLKLLSLTLDISVDELIDNDIKNILVEKFEQTEIKTNKLFKTFVIISIIIILIFVIEIIAVTFYGLGYKKVKTDSTLYVTCELENQKYYFDVSYYNADLVTFQMGGSGYIFENVIDRKEYKGESVIKAVTDVNNYFVSKGGSCK